MESFFWFIQKQMKRECTVCMKEKWNGWMADTCDTHEPLVCKACMKAWLKQSEACPVCRAVVHARAVMTQKKRKLSGDELEIEGNELEAQFAAERVRAKQRERLEQEQRDAQLAREIAAAEERRAARQRQIIQARLTNFESYLARTLPAVLRGMEFVVDE